MSNTNYVLCFVVGQSNFGRNVKMEERRRRKIRSATKDEGLAVSLLGSFGNTGNYAFEVEGTPLTDIAHVVSRALQTRGRPGPKCAAIGARRVRRYLDEALAWPKAPGGKHALCKWGFRWTPGVAFLAEGPTSWGSLPHETNRARLRRLSREAVAVHKRDCLRQGRKALDQGRRLGGWGGVSGDIERSIGGVWTARSHTTLNGLMRFLPN